MTPAAPTRRPPTASPPTAPPRSPRRSPRSRPQPPPDGPPLAPLRPQDGPRRRYRLSREDYVDFQDRQTEVKFEWADGEGIETAGGTAEHNRLKGNLFVLLWYALRGRPGTVWDADQRVRIPNGPYRYPDLSVVTGVSRFEPHPEDKKLTLLNPAVVVEVLSESTAEEDETTKLREYGRIPSVTDYLIFDSESLRLVRRTRTGPEAEWDVTTRTAPADTLSLPALGFAAPLGEIYDGVAFGGA